jgi:glycosyltransferase involved in cell wall biosynthesis
VAVTPEADLPLLSICIATLNRAAFIGDTLDTIVGQLQPGTELVIVDGASTDGTDAVVAPYVAGDPRVRYVRLAKNSGVDQDYDLAVQHARGAYCWLMTDDDLLKPDAVARVLSVLDGRRELIVVNTEVRTADFASPISDALVHAESDREYAPSDADRLMEDTAHALSFIGCVVIKREFWLSRDGAGYYGSLFVHVGVIFESRTPLAYVLSDPLIAIRYGNAMWTSRGFEIWMFKWPSLVWSFPGISDASKSRICAREPWRQLRKLWLYRATGGYAIAEYRRYLAGQSIAALPKFASRVIARVPSCIANALASVYCLLVARSARMNIYDLSRSQHASFVSRAVAKAVGF